MNNNIQGSVIAGRSVNNSNNNNKNRITEENELVCKIRKESAIISFIVGVLSSVFGSVVYHLILGN